MYLWKNTIPSIYGREGGRHERLVSKDISEELEEEEDSEFESAEEEESEFESAEEEESEEEEVISRINEGERWISHYCSYHKILLVGEGDFSFSASLAKAFVPATNMVATSFDSQEKLPVKHWSSVTHLEELRRLGCTVLHDVDVNDMHRHPILKTVKFDRIIFNFPHAGHFPSLHERDGTLIKLHKRLLSGFFNSARKMVEEDGEVHVAHRNDYPYNKWKLEKLAKAAGLVLVECVEFNQRDYPGYHNKRGGKIKSNKKFPLGDPFTFKFSLKKSPLSVSTDNGNLEFFQALDALYASLNLKEGRV